MKKILLIVITFLFTNIIWAQNQFTIDNIVYEVTAESTVEVHDFNDVYEFEDNVEIIIPSKVTNEGIEYDVTSVGDSAFYQHSNIDKLTLPNTITTIGNYSFYWCNMMAPVILHNGLTTIGDRAFQNCFSFADFLIPETVTSIGNAVFAGCKNLQTLYYEAINCEFNVEYLIFPENLEVVNIGEKVQTIPNYFVQGCNVKNINIPDNVTTIKSQAFCNCLELSTVTIGKGVVSIEDAAFSECNDLNTVNFNATNCKFDIEKYLVFPDVIRRINIGENVKNIPDFFVQGCWDLNTITIPNSVTSIGMYAFSNCSGLTSITIPENVSNIKDAAFYGCDALKTLNYNATDCEFNVEYLIFPENLEVVNIGEKVQTIPNNFVQRCNISSISFPENITAIGDFAFYECSNLSDFVSLATTPPTLGKNTFGKTHNEKKLLVPCGSLDAYNSSDWANYFDADNITDDCDDINELSSSFNIYPNPVENELILETEINVEEISIYDIYGRMTTDYRLQTTNLVHSVNVADLEAGVYFVKVVTDKGEIVKRIVKK